MAVYATHVAFDNRVMLRQIEFRLHVEMTLKTGLRIFAGVDDQACRAAGANMLAARTVAGFTTALACHGRVCDVQARVWAHGKFPDNFHMAISAGLVADIMRAGNFQRRYNCGRICGTGIQKKHQTDRKPQQDGRCEHLL